MKKKILMHNVDSLKTREAAMLWKNLEIKTRL